jgi:hypothetical protein
MQWCAAMRGMTGTWRGCGLVSLSDEAAAIAMASL